jgi:hypothetical protein
MIVVSIRTGRFSIEDNLFTMTFAVSTVPYIYNFNPLVFLMEAHCVLREVRTVSLLKECRGSIT